MLRSGEASHCDLSCVDCLLYIGAEKAVFECVHSLGGFKVDLFWIPLWGHHYGLLVAVELQFFVDLVSLWIEIRRDSHASQMNSIDGQT